MAKRIDQVFHDIPDSAKRIRLWAENESWLRSVVAARLGDPASVDDVMQEVALAVVKAELPTQSSRYAPWLYRIAVRQVLLFRRRLDAGGSQGHDDSRSVSSDGQFVWLTFDSPNSEERQAIQVPVVADNEQTRGALLNPPGIIRDDLVTNLRKAGIEVQQQRHFLPLRLPDGRRMIVPVDQVKLRDVAYRDFQ